MMGSSLARPNLEQRKRAFMHEVNFSCNAAFIECDKRPLGPEFKDPEKSEMYSKILPFHACGYNEDFFLQITLNEFPFSEYAPEHQHKSTLLKVARERERPRFVQALEKSLPVLVASIIVNRGEFGPLAANEDEVEWLTKLTGRTKGIAHELLYAAQYLDRYNWKTSTEDEPVYDTLIIQPSVEQESRLLCPDKDIEACLQTIEQRGVKIQTEEEFLDSKNASVVYSYYNLWLKQRVVERDICHQRTVEFFRSHNRQLMPNTVAKACNKFGNWDGFCKAKRGRNTEYLAFLGEVTQNNGHVDEELVCLHVQRIMQKR